MYQEIQSSKKMSIAVVTAFFPIKSKEPTSFYLEKSKFLLNRCKEHMFLFTTKEYAPILSSFRGNYSTTLLIDEFPGKFICPLNFLLSDAVFANMAKKVQKRKKEFLLQKPPRITGDLLKLWLSKSWFVERSIQENSTFDYFIWCDIGSCREEKHINVIPAWPSFKKVQAKFRDDDRLVFYQRRRFQDDTNIYSLDKRPVIAGSHIFGKKSSWKGCFQDVIAQVQENITSFNDLGTDESIYFYLAQNRPEKYRMQFVGNDKDPFDILHKSWFRTYEIDYESIVEYNRELIEKACQLLPLAFLNL